MCASPWFPVRKRPKKTFSIINMTLRTVRTRSPIFFLFDRHEYTHGIFRSVILVIVFILQVYVTFSLFFKIWLTESILIFKESLFRGASFWFLLASNMLRHKFFSDGNRPVFTGMALRKLVKSNYGRKSPVSVKYENLHYFKEGVILFVRVSLKQEEYHIYLAQLTLQSL